MPCCISRRNPAAECAEAILCLPLLSIPHPGSPLPTFYLETLVTFPPCEAYPKTYYALVTEVGYAITEKLDRDQRATLYRAVRRSDHCPVVLKVLGPSARSARDLARLQNELEIAGSLAQPGVLRPLAVETYEGMPALVSEDFAGVPLERLLGNPLDLSRFLTLAVNAASALEAVHRAGIVHKDVTPSSIFVRTDTDEVRLSEFGLASRIPRQPRPGQPPELIEGPLPYMSPEQTGRVNRQVDWRSDLYSLGVTFFFMLTGSLPFVARDPLGWVHAHVARPVPSADDLVPGIPPLLAQIVRRLMEKMPENRYQTARGLRHDLERARQAFVTSGRFEPFPLAELDVAERFHIPWRLYGRQVEQTELLSVFRHVSESGRPALALVAGQAGVGKSALVYELSRTIENTQGFFLSEKFDQYQQNIPYSTLARAFRRALRDLLGGSETRLSAWRARLAAALGRNARLIAEIIPETELILGPQPRVDSLPPLEAEARFRRVFHAFITAFGTAEQPLVLFLDDLQWADIASLNFLGHILAPGTEHVLVIGAYRDNEVTNAHPLLGTIDQIRRGGVLVEQMDLRPLTTEHVLELTGDVVRRPADVALPLAQRVYEKTGGNPFFVVQFLTELVRDGLLAFDGRQWSWDLERIRDRGYTDNVVEFMAARVAGLSQKTCEVLQLAACVGNTVDVKRLAVVAESDEASLERDLAPALQEGLLIREQDYYRFAHDRVQQAAYSLVTQDERPAIHLKVGRLLLQLIPEEEIGDHLFEIVNQLNQGRPLVAVAERVPFAELNLRAGRKAIAAAAYATAKSYLACGLELLPAGAWQSCYELAFGLHLEAARCEFLAGSADDAQQKLAALHARVKQPRDETAVASAEVYMLTVLGRLEPAMHAAQTSLRRSGIDLPLHPAWAEVVRKYEIVQQQLGGRSLVELIDLPVADDPEIQSLMDLIITLMPVALFTDENLLALFALTALELSIQHGLTDATASACLSLSMVLAHRFGKYQEAAAAGRLGRAIVDQRGLTAYRAKVYLDFALVGQWMHPLRENREILDRAFEWAVAAGNLTIACYALNNTISLQLSLGTPLAEVQRESEKALLFVRRARYGLIEAILTSQLRLVLNLRGTTARFSTLDGDDFKEREFVEQLETNPGPNAIAICWHFIRKLQACFYSGDYEEAWSASLRAKDLLWTSRAFMEIPEYHLFTALTAAALHDRRPAQDRPALLDVLRAERDLFQLWAESCPANFLHKLELVEAELCRVQGESVAAMRHYDAAISAAREEGFPHNEGLAFERAARLYKSNGLGVAATLCLDETWRLYLNWRADGKLRQLETTFPEIDARRSATAGLFIGSAAQIDLMAVAKASQAISMELSWDGVTRRLLEVALEHGGADRACLLVEQDGQVVVAAQARADERGVSSTRLVEPVPLSAASAAPPTVVQFSWSNRERVMLNDPQSGAFATDPYVRQRKPRCLLCLPIVSQVEVVGVLYLENDFASGAFTPERVVALELIAGQAAIALADSRLVLRLERENAERARAEAFLEQSRGKLQQIIDNTSALIFVKDAAGRFVLTNTRLEQMLRMEREALKGKTNHDLPTREWADSYRANDLIALRENRPVEFEETAVLEDGEHTFLSIKFPLRDTQGRPYEVCGISTDITGRKRFEDQLRSTVSLLRATLESTGDAILVVDTVGRMVECNRRFLEMRGISDDGPPEPCGGIFLPFELDEVQEPDAFERQLGRLSHDSGESSFDLVEFKNGRVLESYSQPQRLDDRVVGRVWSFRDVTTRVRVERERDRLLVDEHRARTAAEEAVRLRDEFLSVASHELRTPLTSLQLAIQGMSRRLGTDDAPTLKRNLAMCTRQLKRLGDLVCRLLDVSRINAGHFELEPQAVDLREVVLDISAQLSEDLARSGSEFAVHADLPVVGFWDRFRIEQVVINLLSNAIKFGEGSPIEVLVEGTTDTARLTVTDHGLGMSADIQARIFERFGRGVSARHYGGLGLGLYIARMIVEAHGGRVRVTSAVGRGSAFKVELPLQPMLAKQEPSG